MTKHTRKPSARQRDPLAVATAKILKRKGLLSKQAKLHGGKFLSPSVLKRVEDLQHFARSDYQGVKATPAQIRAAKAEGYLVSNSRVILPKGHEYKRRLESGLVTGVKPVKGGFISEVELPISYHNLGELIRDLENGDLDNLKLEDEMFAFSTTGVQGIGMSRRAFFSVKDMAEYLEHYDPEMEISHLTFFRLHSEDQPVLGLIRRNADKELIAQHKEYNRTRKRASGFYAKRMERLQRRNPDKAEALRERSRERSRKQYQAKRADPKAWAIEVERQRLYRASRKPKE